MTHKGKIGRLPFSIREELNIRLLNGESGSRILPWLNSLPDVVPILEMEFGGADITAENLSQWRMGGYAAWLRRREQLDRTHELAQVATQLAKAGGSTLAEGAAAILAGKVMDVLEGIEQLVVVSEDGAPESPEEAKRRLETVASAIDSLTLAVTRLRKGDHSAENLRLLRERLAQSAEALELERSKFQRQTCELFLKWHDNHRARNIVDGPGTSEEKIEKLGQAMFGDLWK